MTAEAVDTVNSSGLPKLNAYDRRDLMRELAAGEVSRADLARRFGISRPYVTKFARQWAAEIDRVRATLDDAYAGLWIARKENRVLAHQADYDAAQEHEKGDHHEWIKARTQILHAVAEELGQLPPRATVTVMPVLHIIEGVDISALA